MLRHICVNYMNFLPEVLFKTTKTAKKTYLYQLGIDMVLAKLNMASLSFYPPVPGVSVALSVSIWIKGGQQLG